MVDRIELEHSERQEIMRDKHNRVMREDMETLDSHGVFKREKIVKVKVS